MTRKALRAAVLMVVLPAASAPGPSKSGESPESSWRALPLIRDGKVHPDWTQIGWGHFVVAEGALRTECDPKGMGLLLYKKEKLGNCQIRVVYKCKDAKSNAGVFVRIDDGILTRLDERPAVERDSEGRLVPGAMEKLMEASEKEKGPWYPVHHGYEVQICEDSDEYHRSGAVYSLAKAAPAPGKPPADWKTMVITLEGNRILVDIDGKRVTSFDPDGKDVPQTRRWFEPKREPKRPESGFLGLQNHDPGDVVWFKEVSVRPLAAPASGPLLRTVDLDRGEVQEVELADGTKAKVKLIDVEETRDGLRSAIRQARVKVAVNGEEIVLISATYRLPTAVAGAQIDCPVTKGHYLNCDPFEDSWGLDKDARLRLWPAGSPWTVPGTFVYPVAQRWFASDTQMANEPSFVDGGDAPSGRKIYYHSGLDIGGCEGRVDVVAASEGLVVSAGGETLPEYPEVPFYKRAAYDCVYVLDAQGWFYRYAHLKSIDPAVRPGQRVKVGQKLGLLGKEGSSGGWAHLHFDIKSRQPSGKWGIQEGYAFIWEAYQREYRPKLVAVARPHHLASVGEKVALDASRSWSALGRVLRHEWTFIDGTMAAGPRVERTYDRPGCYSEVLKVSDSQGRADLDFAVVQVLDKSQPENLPPTIHASFAPTLGIRPGDPVTFKVRSFRTAEGSERWDFGDGSSPVTVQSDGNSRPMAPDGYAETVHRYAKPGLYLVRVERAGSAGARAIAHLQVRVGDEP